MKHYKMVWGDVLRMQGDFAFPPETFDSIEFAPAKEMYEEFGNPVMLRKAVIGSFLASSKKIPSSFFRNLTISSTISSVLEILLVTKIVMCFLALGYFFLFST